MLWRTSLTVAAVTWSCLLGSFLAEELCSILPSTYTEAKKTYPHLTPALETVEKSSIAAWYTDRLSAAERSELLSSITEQCSKDTRMVITVYGIPNKDCNAGLSSSGSVHSTSDYESFLSELTKAVGDRKVLYIVEPDAVGLLAKGGCGKSAGYLDNLKVAVQALSANANAQLYVDVGYWLLADPSAAEEVGTIMKALSASGKLKGVTINTSNYRSTDECTTYCSNFQKAVGSQSMTCIIDTSRNYNGNPTTDWCNIKSAGIGKPPTSNTGIPNVDYFLWIKVPGESDGICTSVSTSDQSLTGVTAGSFYLDGFLSLWDQGYFVNEKAMNPISGNNNMPTQSSNETDMETAKQTDTDNSVYQASEVGQEADTPKQSVLGTVVPAGDKNSKNTTVGADATELAREATLTATPVVAAAETKTNTTNEVTPKAPIEDATETSAATANASMKTDEVLADAAQMDTPTIPTPVARAPSLPASASCKAKKRQH
ncbi:hypothetical protein PsorP6_006907 [Peronosclerospora sorghi]|uniref:Uncharacterized protein n=1 Tax=Peronosclerospora sorghi TaxID=230839 RepID=A0ACC0WBB6_9STRA|nr:hypothetical protein PsorP6_006907 [Peronosclerospora sorghi]